MKRDNTPAPVIITISQDTIERFGSKDAKFTWILGEAIKRGISIPEEPQKTA